MKVALASAVIVSTAFASASAQICLHGPNEAFAQRTRREAAIRLAEQIKVAEARLMPPNRQPRRAQPLEQLPNIGPIPPGFEVQLLTQDDRYSLTIRDTQDPCGYAIFTDQASGIYDGVPTRPPVPLIVPLGTH